MRVTGRGETSFPSTTAAALRGARLRARCAATARGGAAQYIAAGCSANTVAPPCMLSTGPVCVCTLCGTCGTGSAQAGLEPGDAPYGTQLIGYRLLEQ
eukprot:3501061-Prymnesium_polylepis.2